jgi:hypothetical protein
VLYTNGDVDEVELDLILPTDSILDLPIPRLNVSLYLYVEKYKL